MNDAKRLFLDDSKEKKRTGYSASKKAHTAKRVKFPSDYLTEKEKRKMNGPVTEYNLTQPMKWREFKKLPDDLKKKYILRLRNLYNAPATALGDMFGVNRQTVINEQLRLQIPSLPKGTRAAPEFASFCKYGTPAERTFTPIRDLIPPELKAKLDEYEEKHPPAVITEAEPSQTTEAPSCEENVPHSRLSAKDYGSLNYVSGCLSALRAIYATDTNYSFYDGALGAIGQIIDSVEVYV